MVFELYITACPNYNYYAQPTSTFSVNLHQENDRRKRENMDLFLLMSYIIYNSS